MNEKLLLLFSLISLTVCDKFRFDNYSLFKILPKTEKDVVLIQALQNNDISLDFWNDPIPGAEYVNIMTTPAKRSSLEAFLNLYGIDFEVTIENIQEAIDKESVSSYTRNSRSMRWDTYYKMADIDAWMNDMAAAYPDIASSIVGGATYEGRQIRGLKISHGTGRKIIFIESGIHAREWIAPATACYIINELLTSDDEQTRAAVEEYDWYIFPVTNPDGYVWTHEEYRLWRKNRRPVGTEFGIDLNRNWNSNWLVEGVSTNPQSNTYAGTGPFSEVETRTLSTYIQSISSDITLYISFHSSGQLLLIPYGNTTDPLDNYYDALNIGRRAMGALSVRYGTPYTTGNIAEAIYLATGTSIDWVKEHLRVPLTYCYELRDRGTYGHLLPADQILPNSQEVMDSLLELIHQGERFGYLNNGVGIQGSIAMMFLILLKTLF